MSLSDVIQLGVMIVTAIGVLYSIYKGFKDKEVVDRQIQNLENQISIQQAVLKEQAESNKNNVIIKKAEYSDRFVCNFRSMMPSLAFCSAFAIDMYKSNKDLYSLYNSLNLEHLDFNVITYKELLKRKNLTYEKVQKILNSYRDNYENIIAFSKENYNTNGLGNFNKFHGIYNIYRKNMKKYDNSDFIKEKEQLTELNEVDDYTKINLKIIFANSIYAKEQDTYNDFECMSLSVQFDLIDIEKLTNLVWAPLHYYIKSCYIRIMQNKISQEENGDIVFSNISNLYQKIKERKEKQSNSLLEQSKEKSIRDDDIIKDLGEKVLSSY